MKIKNIESTRTGRPVANQFIIEETKGIMGNFESRLTFQSYDSIIAQITVWGENAIKGGKIETILDEKYWDYSKTTGKYRNQFLGENIEETRKKISNGKYQLANLNE